MRCLVELRFEPLLETVMLNKAMLIMPPFTQSKQSMRRCLFPLGIGYLSAVLSAEGFDVLPLDCIMEGYDTIRYDDNELTYGLCDFEIKNRIKSFMPDYIGVSALISKQAKNAHRVCKLAKEVNPNIETIMGGGHPSAVPDQVLSDPNVDHVVVGDGEVALLQIVTGKASGFVRGGVDIKALLWPARRLFDMEKYFKINMPTSVFSLHNRVTQVEFTRSCPFDCCFCATTQFRGDYQKRDVDDCLDEVVFLKETYQIDELDIIDSNLIVDKTLMDL